MAGVRAQLPCSAMIAAPVYSGGKPPPALGAPLAHNTAGLMDEGCACGGPCSKIAAQMYSGKKPPRKHTIKTLSSQEKSTCHPAITS